jgi:preprotein translocase subunit SecY
MIKSGNPLIQRIQATLLLIFLLRLGTFIPVPNIDQRYLDNAMGSNFLFQLINSNTNNNRLGLFSLGIIPYINASIIIQLLTSVVPKLERLQKEEGEQGRKTLKQYNRILTFLFALQQGISIALEARVTQFNWNNSILIDVVLSITVGGLIVLWLSEQINELGIGNGPSVIIATSIISSLPTDLSRFKNLANINFAQLGFLLLIISCIVFIQEATRKIPLISAKQLFNRSSNTNENDTYLPLRINQGGVMPIIFTSATIGFFISITKQISQILPVPILTSSVPVTIGFTIIKFILILGFTFFYSTIILNPKEIAKDLNKMAVAIKDVRPGIQTEKFLTQTLNRLGTLGALFLALLITLPNVKTESSIGLTSFLILISIITELERQILTFFINESYNTSSD